MWHCSGTDVPQLLASPLNRMGLSGKWRQVVHSWGHLASSSSSSPALVPNCHSSDATQQWMKLSLARLCLAGCCLGFRGRYVCWVCVHPTQKTWTPGHLSQSTAIIWTEESSWKDSVFAWKPVTSPYPQEKAVLDFPRLTDRHSPTSTNYKVIVVLTRQVLKSKSSVLDERCS